MNLDEIDNLIGNVDIKGDNAGNDFDDIVNFNDNFGLNNISFDYDDNDVLYKEESSEEVEETPVPTEQETTPEVAEKTEE